MNALTSQALLDLTDEHFQFLSERGFEGPSYKIEQREGYPFVEYRKESVEARIEFWHKWPELLLIRRQPYPATKVLCIEPDFAQYPALAMARRLLGRFWRIPLLFHRRELAAERRKAVAELGMRLRQDYEGLMRQLGT